MADIFISYTSSDRDWAQWLHKELEALGHTPHIHEWEIGAGDDIYAWMERRHDAADHVLCVVSDDYLKAPYSTLERNAALWQAASQRPGFVIMVVVKACRLPTLADHLRRCELFGISEDAARDRFRTFMAAPATKVSYFPGQTFAVSNIPINVPLHFMGRDEPLAAIAAALARYEGRVAITALHGLRGVGKTTLAAAYAERHRADYRATWWLRAQTEATLRADLVGLGVRLGWVEPDAKEEPGLAAVMERLRHEGEGILLIYDNAIDAGSLKPYLPRGGAARVLVTSNAPTWRGLAEPVEIRLWPAAVGADYLVARTGREAERAAAEALSDALGGLPLAHEQAAAYCERLEIGLGEYAKRFAATPAKFLDDAKHAPEAYHDGLTVAKTFALAIEKAAKLHPAAESLIVHAALFAPEPIPLFLFEEGREYFVGPLSAMLAEDGLIEAIAALRAFALIDREVIADGRDPSITTDTIRLHRLVRETASKRAEGQARLECLTNCIDALANVYPDTIWRDPVTWPRARVLDALALAAIRDEIPSDATLPATDLMMFLSQYRRYALASRDSGKTFVERALRLRIAVLGEEHVHTSSSMDSLARILREEGDIEGARRQFERALQIREKIFGSLHPKVATSLNNLARTVQDQGDVNAARALYERSLAISEQIHGRDHIETMIAKVNLTTLMKEQGNLQNANEEYESALAVFERAFGPEHPLVAVAIGHIASALEHKGDYESVIVRRKHALAIYEKIVGPDHPDTATALNNLAETLREQGDFSSAQPLLQRALAIREKVLGVGHPRTAMSLNNFAHLLHQQGDFTLAKLHFERALRILESARGFEHADTATCLNNFALLLQDRGDFISSKVQFKRAFAAFNKSLGSDHIKTHRCGTNHASLSLQMGEAGEARLLAQTALATHSAQRGPDHPWTKDSARVTADALAALGEAEKATEVRAKYGV